jgi:hypothetical protein
VGHDLVPAAGVGVGLGVWVAVGLADGAGVGVRIGVGAGVNEGAAVGLALTEGVAVGLLARPPVGLPRAMPPDELAEGELIELLQPTRTRQTRPRRAAPSFEPDLDGTDREDIFILR